MEDSFISTRTFALIEIVFSFSLVLGFCVWQIVSVRRAIARRKAGEAARRGERTDAD